jgi:hypothetical protein
MKMKRMMFVVLGFSLLLPCSLFSGLWATMAAQGKTLTVSQTPGAAMFIGIQAAIDAANPGDTVLVLDSANYAEHLKITKNQVTLTAADGQLPVLSGMPGAPDTLDLIDVSGTDGVTIRRLKLTQGTDDGITASPGPGAKNLTIEGCQFEALNDTGILLNNQSTGAIIHNCTFSGLGTGTDRSGGGIVIRDGSTATISGCRFENLVGTSVFVGSVLAGPTSATVTNNTFLGGPMTGEFSDGVAIQRASVDIIGNRFIEVGRIAIGTFRLGETDGPPRRDSEVNIINNLIVASGTSAEVMSADGMQLLATANSRFRFNIINNTITDNTRGAFLYAIEAAGSSATVINNILAFSLGNADILFTAGGARRVADLTVKNSLITNQGPLMLVGQNGNITGDPKYADPNNGDFRLSASSPAVNAGDNSAPGLPMTDLDGKPRVAGAAVDMGAFEFQP